MNKLIGILFGLVASVIHLLGGSAVAALAILPCMMERTIKDVAAFCGEANDAILTAGIFGTIDRTARKMGSEFRDGNAEHLLLQNVLNALSTIGHQRLQASVKPLDYFAKENTRLRHWVEKGCFGRSEHLFRQQVKHLIGK